MAALRLQKPLNYDFPPYWRTRLADIEADLADGGPVSKALLGVQQTILKRGEVAAKQELGLVLQSHGDLLPGDAGYALAWAIIVGEPPALRRAGPQYTERLIFEEEVPPYVARTKTQGRNRFASRKRRKDVAEVLALLRPDILRPPLTYKQVAAKLGLSGEKFQREVSRLRRRGGVRLRSSEDQKLVAGLLAESRPSYSGRSWRRKGSEKTLTLRIEDVPLRTGLSAEELERELGRQRTTVYHQERPDEKEEVIVGVPVEYLIDGR